MSLSEHLRDELAAIVPMTDCDRLAELSGLFHTAGSVHLRGRGEVAVHLDLASAAVARRAFALLRAQDVSSEIRTYKLRAFDHEMRFQLHVDGDGHALQTLYEGGVLTRALGPLEHPPRRVVGRACCRAAYVRGALLGGGSLSGPRAAHLEIRCASVDGARFVADLARREAAPLAVVDRGRHVAAYAKGIDAIVGILALAGASSTVLVLEEAAVVATTRARANRIANADHANLVRTSRSAHDQLRAVERLERNGELEKLSARLREVAALRRRHPTLPLRELAVRCEPPATKAAISRRLRKLQQLAEL